MRVRRDFPARFHFRDARVVISSILFPLWAALPLFGAVTPKDAGKVDFNRDIRPILAENCFKCHGPGEEERKAKLRFDVRDEALKPAKSGSVAIVPGAPEKSEMIARITAGDPDDRMPPAKTGKVLQPAQIDVLRRWIADGAAYAKHWAYVKPVRPAVPQIKNSRWPRNAIDRFILSRLETERLTPSLQADRATLIRRVSLDLTGLPPTIEEVDEFLQDTSPNAYEHLVDRLLSKPAFGEHWARMWLDLARYADSTGYAEDLPRTIWRFRDYVIKSFNANKPFDRFTIEQIAGDLLDYPDDDTETATAFHRNTMTNTEGGTEDEEFRNAAVVDRVNTTMSVWMGTTMGCAQCHTHKYDPLSQKEYFQLFAFFNNTEDADRNDEAPVLDFTAARLRKHYDELKAEIEKLDKRIDAEKEKLEKGEKEKPKTESENKIKTDEANKPAAESKDQRKSEAAETPGSEAATKGATEANKAAKETENTPKVEAKEKSTEETENKAKGEAAQDKPATESPKEKEQTAPALTEAESAKSKAEAELKADRERLEKLRKELSGITLDTVPVMRELMGDKRRTTHVEFRGNYLALGDEVTPAVPAVFPPLPKDAPTNRLTLARWLVDENNPLTARVVANRFWEQIFGIGLVRTVEDFGSQGERPTHPELLDWLATELVARHWNVKEFLKLLVTSATYCQSSAVNPTLLARDPDNLLLARGPRFRASAEVIRDQALAVSGLLSSKMYGPPVRPPQPSLGLSAAFSSSLDWKTSEGEDRYRRAVYVQWRRTNPYATMASFDAPSREVCTLRRPRSNTPLQALVILNDPVYVEAARALGLRMSEAQGSISERLAYGFRLCLARPPRPEELSRLLAFYERAKKEYAAKPQLADQMAAPPPASLPVAGAANQFSAWATVGNVLLNLDEMLMKP